MAMISIKYKKRGRGKRIEVIKTVPKEVIITIDEEKRILKFKQRIISRVCRDLGLKKDRLTDPDINTVEIIKDLGRTAYDI